MYLCFCMIQMCCQYLTPNVNNHFYRTLNQSKFFLTSQGFDYHFVFQATKEQWQSHFILKGPHFVLLIVTWPRGMREVKGNQLPLMSLKVALDSSSKAEVNYFTVNDGEKLLYRMILSQEFCLQVLKINPANRILVLCMNDKYNYFCNCFLWEIFSTRNCI